MIIDELHNFLAGSSIKQQNFLNAIKFLCNELKVCVVGCGTAELIHAVSIDSQIQNRFRPEVLPVWKLNREYRSLLASIEKIMPFPEVSNLSGRELATKIFSLSGGTIGETLGVVRSAASYAIEHSQNKITLEAIDSCAYIEPSRRKNLASLV